MKFIILIILIITIIGCSLNSTEKSVTINLTLSEFGYDIYNEDAELLLEFTNKNCSGKELNLLKFIYESTKEKNEFINLIPTKEGYDFSSDDGEMLLKFTDENYSKEELDLLKYIYDVTLEQRDN